MMKLAPSILLLALCCLIYFGSIFLSADGLPARLATHFDMQGRPNGWMSRANFVDFMLAFGIIVPAFIVGTMTFSGYIPVSFVKLPNRDYWLAPERRRTTSAILLRFALVLASMVLLFITGLYGLTVQANSGTGARMSGTAMAILAGTLLLGTVIWVLALRRRFARLP